jgi:hypothetical protein
MNFTKQEKLDQIDAAKKKFESYGTTVIEASAMLRAIGIPTHKAFYRLRMDLSELLSPYMEAIEKLRREIEQGDNDEHNTTG